MRCFCVCLLAFITIAFVVAIPNRRSYRTGGRNALVSHGSPSYPNLARNSGYDRNPDAPALYPQNLGVRGRYRGSSRFRGRGRKFHTRRGYRPYLAQTETFYTEIVLDGEFDDDLFDPNSEAFMNLAMEIEDLLLPIYQAIYGPNVEIRVVKFQKGSIKIIIKIIVPAGVTINADDVDELKSQIISELEEAGFPVDDVTLGVNIVTEGPEVTDESDTGDMTTEKSDTGEGDKTTEKSDITNEESSVTEDAGSDTTEPEFVTDADSAATDIPCQCGDKPTYDTNADDVDELNSRMIDVHNYYRCLHGADPLTEDSDLKEAAQMVAGKNAAADDLFHPTDDDFTYGENLYYKSVPFTSLTGCEVVQAWYDEIDDPGYDFTNPGFTSGIGHFTQVVWKDATTIGCYAVDGTSGAYVACEYDTGNVIGQFEANVCEKIEECID